MDLAVEMLTRNYTYFSANFMVKNVVFYFYLIIIYRFQVNFGI